MVLYESRYNGTNHTLGTSGFLYRSNKVMYDRETTSLWSTLHGEPVVGPLVGKGIKLKRRSVVTTTWGEWKKRHPKTTVLSLDTGHRRDYGEGVAYNSYFSTDEVMFNVPKLDKRLPNKREVVALRTDAPGSAVAVDTEYLKKNRIYPLKVASDNVVIITTPKGESRVYESKGITFKKWDGKAGLVDANGTRWTLTEGSLQKNGSEEKLTRYPSHQSFWFGWHAQFPKSRLIHK